MKRDAKTGILYEQWDQVEPRAVLLLVHGLGGHSQRWEFLARFLLAAQIASYAIDLKGFGETQELKGHIDSFRIYFEDICRLREIVKEEHPQAKIFLLGESLGGLLSFLLAAREPALFDGLICISPAFKSRLKFPRFIYLQVLKSFFFNPQKQFRLPFTAQMVTRDTNYQLVMEEEVKEHRLASAKLLINVLLAEKHARSLKEKLSIPTLFLIAGEDFLVDPKESLRIFKQIKFADKEIIEYAQMYHALSIDLGREKVFADIVRWVQERLR